MWLRYTNFLSQASRSVAMGILTVGLLLVGFGAVIVAFPDVFAYLAAAVFFVVGMSFVIAALKMLWAQRRLDRFSQDPSAGYRQNVRIRDGDDRSGFGDS